MSVAVALIIVDSTIVNVAIPSVVADLHLDSTAVEWVQESYTLVFAALLLVFGSLADRFGRRRLLQLGVAIFAISSVGAALAPDGGLLIATRFVQGAGGAMILPTTLSILNSTFRGRERGIAFAVWGSTIGGMAAVGPILGGWLTTDFSWRWAFGINLPLGALLLVASAFVVRESRAGRGSAGVDVVGALLSVVLFGALVYGLIEGRTVGWWTIDHRPTIGGWRWPLDLSPIPIAFAIALLALVGYIAWGMHRRRVGKDPIIAFELFRIPSFRGGNIAALIVALGEFGIILSLPLWLQNVLGYDALQTGLVLLSLAVGSFVASGFAATAGGRIGALRIVRIGIAAEIVGLVVVALVIAPDTPWWPICIGLFVYGFGVGLATAQLTGVVLADVPVERSGQASGTQSTSRQVGSALGIAILGTILFSSLGGILAANLPHDLPQAQRDAIVTAVVDSSGGAIPSLGARSPAAETAAKEAFSDATRAAAFAAAGALALGLVATLTLRAPSRPEGDQAAADSPATTSSTPSP